MMWVMVWYYCRFTLKVKGGGDDATEEVTVYDYFVNIRKIELRYSGDLPCINVGKPKRPTYFPLEVDMFNLVFRFAQKHRKVHSHSHCSLIFISNFFYA